jgi:hypothetical protein
MEKYILIGSGIFDVRVCAEATYDEALDWLQRTNPAGTQNNWSKNGDGAFAPIVCADHPERTHYMFDC